MKSCPGCEFLIDDVQEICEFCAADPGYASRLKGFTTKTVVGALADNVQLAGAVGVLERPVASGVNWEETDLTPRSRSSVRQDSKEVDLEFRRGRRQIPGSVVMVGALMAVAAVIFMSVSGYGPLAEQFAKLGLSRSTSRVLPSRWSDHVDAAGTFSVELPDGSDVVFEPLDPTGAVPGGLYGDRVEGLSDSYLFVGFTDLGLGAEGLAAFDSDEGVSELAARFAKARIPGELTLNRTQLTPYGHASDSVYVSSDGSGVAVESRLRTILTGGRVHVLVTSGAESDASELDAAHKKLLESFKPTI